MYYLILPQSDPINILLFQSTKDYLQILFALGYNRVANKKNAKIGANSSSIFEG